MKFLDTRYQILDTRKGFTLVELIVAVGLFLAIVSIAVGGFIQSLGAQRQIAGLIAAENGISLALEQMAREIRTGYNFCHDANGNPLCSGSNEFIFTNAAGETIAYRLSDVSIERGVAGTFQQITGGNVVVKDMSFLLRGNQSGDGWPPRITVSLGVSSKERGASATVLRIETTVSARTLDG